MSDYKVFIKDFPSRCEKLLNRIEKGHKLDDLEVTGLIMVASAAINIPYERLQPVKDNSIPHPSSDVDKYSEAAQQFKQLLDSNFMGSDLYPNNTLDWKIATLKSVEGTPDDWKEKFEKIDKDKSVSYILEIIRNSLAHGNIYTKAHNNEIEEILLVSVQRQREQGKLINKVQNYRCISLTPKAFSLFMDKWFKYFSELPLPEVMSFHYEPEYRQAAATM